MLRTALHRAILIAALCLLAACAGEAPAPVLRENVVQLSATVTAIDMSSRLVSLRGEDGRAATVYVGPEVRNLEQVEVGDIVTVAYYEAIGAVLTKSQEAQQGEEHATAALRAAAGRRPAAAVGRTSTTTVKIEAVDKSSNTVTFRRPDGTLP